MSVWPVFGEAVSPSYAPGVLGNGNHGWRMLYGRCGRCHTNFASATLTFCPLVVAGHTNNTTA